MFMATVKIKFRSSTISGKPGIVYYQLTHRCAVRLIRTPLRLPAEDWDAENACIRPSADEWASVQNRIDSDLALLQRIIHTLDSRLRFYTVDDIVERFNVSESPVSVIRFLHEQIDRLRRCNRFGTALNYERALHSFSSFLGAADLPFMAMTESLIEDYNSFLTQRGIVRNSISFYMRILRAVYNKAVRLRLVEQTFPFRNVYTGIDRTRKRAVSEKIIAKLYRLDLPANAPLAFARDLFIFSYATRGMPFVDMACLRKSDIRDGMIRYARHKTRQPLCIRLEPCMQRIIARYSDCVRDSAYIFPILTSEGLETQFRQYRAALNTYNVQLRKLSSMLGLDFGISSYMARHSWATAARNHNVPISVISAGMGHTSEHTTRIYLTQLENSTIDAANRKILAELKE